MVLDTRHTRDGCVSCGFVPLGRVGRTTRAGLPLGNGAPADRSRPTIGIAELIRTVKACRRTASSRATACVWLADGFPRACGAPPVPGAAQWTIAALTHEPNLAVRQNALQPVPCCCIPEAPIKDIPEVFRQPRMPGFPRVRRGDTPPSSVRGVPRAVSPQARQRAVWFPGWAKVPEFSASRAHGWRSWPTGAPQAPKAHIVLPSPDARRQPHSETMAVHHYGVMW